MIRSNLNIKFILYYGQYYLYKKSVKINVKNVQQFNNFVNITLAYV